MQRLVQLMSKTGAIALPCIDMAWRRQVPLLEHSQVIILATKGPLCSVMLANFEKLSTMLSWTDDQIAVAFRCDKIHLPTPSPLILPFPPPSSFCQSNNISWLSL